MSTSGNETGRGRVLTGPTVQSERGETLVRVAFEKDEIIFPEGEASTDAYVVESGSIGIFKTIDGLSVRLGAMEKGAVFGEMAAVTGAHRSATAVALGPSVVVRISGAVVQKRLASCDPFIKALIHILINNLGRINERFAVQHHVADQLLHDLERGAEAAAEKTAVA